MFEAPGGELGTPGVTAPGGGGVAKVAVLLSVPGSTGGVGLFIEGLVLSLKVADAAKVLFNVDKLVNFTESCPMARSYDVG